MTNGIVIGLSALAGVWLGWHAVAISASIVALVLMVERDFRWPLIATCVILASIGAGRSVQPGAPETSPILASSTGAVGRVASFPRPSGDGHRVIFSVSELCINEQCIPANEKVVLYISRQQVPIARGQVLSVDWRLQPLRELPEGYRGFVQSQDATASARADSVRIIEPGHGSFKWLASMNKSIGDSIFKLLPGDTGALATGIITGNDAELSDETVEDFRSTGTAHITAVSGQNVTIILGFLSLWWRPRSVVGRWLYHIGLILVIWSYATLVGLEPPALRAAIVATLTILGSHVGRRPDPVTLLALTLGAIAVVQPLVVHGVGFWLSATASMALCLALPQQLSGGPGRTTIDIALGPVVASLATMPIVLMTFGTWSPISILANILIAPVITLAFWVTYPFALLTLFLPGLAGLLAWIPGIVLDVVLVIVMWLAPIAGQIRVDELSALGTLILCLPIVFGIWLLSSESDRWIRSAHRVFR